MQLSLRDRLSFPAGVAPGFDPRHVASKGTVRFSGVAQSPGSFVNILNGKVGTIGGSLAGSMNGIGGPISCGAAANSVSFAGNATATDTTYTLAGIINGDGTEQGALSVIATASSLGAGGVVLKMTGTGTDNYVAIDVSGGVGGTSPTPAVYVGNVGPVFVVLSRQPGGASPLTMATVTYLRTGKIVQTAYWTDYGYAAGASDGTYVVGGSGTGSHAGAGVATAMFSNTALSPQEMLAWAQDPWSFWYPRRDLIDGLETPASAFAPTYTASPRQAVYAGPPATMVS